MYEKQEQNAVEQLYKKNLIVFPIFFLLSMVWLPDLKSSLHR